MSSCLVSSEVGGADQRADDAPADDPEHGQQREVDGEHVERVAPVEPARVAALGRAASPGRQLPVVQHGVGDDLHAVAGRLDPPAEVEVVAEQPEPGVEPAELIPHVAPDEHARRAHGEHGPLVVVLALVDLARVDAGDRGGPPGRWRRPPRGASAGPGRRAPWARAPRRSGPCSPPAAAARARPGPARSRRAAARSTRPGSRFGSVMPGPPPGRVPQRDRDRLAVARWTAPCRRPRPGRSARRARPRCDPGFRCPRRPPARPGRSAPGAPGRGRAASEHRRARR